MFTFRRAHHRGLWVAIPGLLVVALWQGCGSWKKPAQTCAATGPAQHWVNGYCLLLNQTEDLTRPLVKDCVRSESQRLAAGDDCAVSTRYKTELCQIHIRQRMITVNTVEDCLANPDYDILWKRAP